SSTPWMCGVTFSDTPRSSNVNEGGGVYTCPPVCALAGPKYPAVMIGYRSPTCSVAGIPSSARTDDCTSVRVFDLDKVATNAELAIPIPNIVCPPPKNANWPTADATVAGEFQNDPR